MQDPFDNDRSRKALDDVVSSLRIPRIPRAELQFDDGFAFRGGFSLVRRATWLRHQASPSLLASEAHSCDNYVAVKELNCLEMPPRSLPLRVALQFARELKVWSTLEHPNILRCLGFDLDIVSERGHAYFVSPFISGGSIRARLKSATDPPMDQRIQWVVDLTRGLHYLHTFKCGDEVTPVVHGDLKPSNILIDDTNQAMLCDFGLSLIIKEAESTGLTTSDDFKGSIRWCSPELAYDERRTTSSDVWAWALCVLEIITNRLPFYQERNDMALSLRIAQRRPPSREEYPELAATSVMWDVLESCLHGEPGNRSTMQECWRQIMPLENQDYSSFLNGHGDVSHPRNQDEQQVLQDGLPGAATDPCEIPDCYPALPDPSNVFSDPSKFTLPVTPPSTDIDDVTHSTAFEDPSNSLGDPTVVSPRQPSPTARASIGKERKYSLLVVGMDLGTVSSGVSYAFLGPRTKPKVRDVLFRLQENELGITNPPTILFRDEACDVWYCGAETMGLTEEEKSRLLKFERFKVQLMPTDVDEPGESLPQRAVAWKPSPVDLFSRYFKYLHGCLKSHFETTEVNGPEVWQQVVTEAVYVVTHPNDWSSWHQARLRRALVDASIVSSEHSGRVTFLSEGEASLHWWLTEDPHRFELNSQVVICDAGGGMIDVSSYAVTRVTPLRLTETKPGETKVAGSTFVAQAFRDHITGRLHGSTYGRADMANRMVQEFETNIKCLFADPQTTQRIDFGFADDNDEEYGIKSGALSVSGQVMERLFEPSCLAAIEAIRNHAGSNSYVVLIGGFCGSPWLFQRVSAALKNITSNVKRVSSQQVKPAARGAVDFFLNNRTIFRIAKRTLGLPLDIAYNTSLPSHIDRKGRIKIDPVSEHQLLPGGFRSIVTKGDVLNDDSVRWVECTKYMGSEDGGHDVILELAEYTGRLSDIEFMDLDEASSFRSLGKFTARIPPAAFRRIESISLSEKVYWEVRYNICFIMGQTEIKCYVEWTEKGATKRLLAVPHWKKH